MRRFVNLAICVLILGIPAMAGGVDDKLANARAAAKAFGMELKGELQAAMTQGGAINGIEVCNVRAEEIAQSTSKSLGLEIGRTSLKVRNASNAPDDWELDVLAQFEARKTNGEPVGDLEHFEVVQVGEGKTFRYMKAIPTGEVCLACHGERLNPELGQRLDELYPQDKARGFKEGDIRGAFTVSQPM